MAMYEGLRSSFPDAEIVNADELTATLRAQKSPAELACLREGFRLGELALEALGDVLYNGGRNSARFFLQHDSAKIPTKKGLFAVTRHPKKCYRRSAFIAGVSPFRFF